MTLDIASFVFGASTFAVGVLLGMLFNATRRNP